MLVPRMLAKESLHQPMRGRPFSLWDWNRPSISLRSSYIPRYLLIRWTITICISTIFLCSPQLTRGGPGMVSPGICRSDSIQCSVMFVAFWIDPEDPRHIMAESDRGLNVSWDSRIMKGGKYHQTGEWDLGRPSNIFFAQITS